jgi:hypothetical protein
LFSLATSGGILISSLDTAVVTSSPIYYMAVANINENVWYSLELSAAQAPIAGYGLVSIGLVADSSPQAIKFSESKAFEYYHIEDRTLAPNNILASLSGNSPVAGAIYQIVLTFNTTFDSAASLKLKFSFINQDYSSLPLNSPNLINTNFRFAGSCNVICNSLVNCFQPISCSLNAN